MIRRLCQRTFNAARTFLRDQGGSIVIYTGAFMSIGMGGAALSIDIGRIVLLKTQMQNRADAGALAGAAQLDAQNGAIVRAEYIIQDAMVAYTTAAADQGELAVWSVSFYQPAEDYITRGAETTDDVAARFAEAHAFVLLCAGAEHHDRPDRRQLYRAGRPGRGDVGPVHLQDTADDDLQSA
jgi:uncharacterized membrane protein